MDITLAIKRLCFQIVNKKIEIPFVTQVGLVGAADKGSLFC
jgi:hypothetical protein